MGGKSDGGNEAEMARTDEQARQARIRQGTKAVNSIFDGGMIGDGAVGNDAVYDPTKTYYLTDGSVWSPTGNAARSFSEMAASGQLFGGTKTLTGFNPDFFSGRKQSFLDYANPQLDDQYGDAQRELTFALDRAGLLDSSARATKAAELQKKYDLNKQQIADQALSYETQAKSAVEDARSNLIATLNATGDAQGAANSAITRASVLSQPAAYSPLSQLFADFTSTLGTQAALEKANYYSGGQTGARYTTGLFAPSSNAVVVR